MVCLRFCGIVFYSCYLSPCVILYDQHVSPTYDHPYLSCKHDQNQLHNRSLQMYLNNQSMPLIIICHSLYFLFASVSPTPSLPLPSPFILPFHSVSLYFLFSIRAILFFYSLQFTLSAKFSKFTSLGIYRMYMMHIFFRFVICNRKHSRATYPTTSLPHSNICNIQ